jgi:hypothetical protein
VGNRNDEWSLFLQLRKMKMANFFTIIWKRVHDTHSLFIHDTTREYVATITTPDTTKSKQFQTFMGCHHWFTRELAEIGIKKNRVDEPNTPWGR